MFSIADLILTAARQGERRAIVNSDSIANTTTEIGDVDKETSHIALSPTQESAPATEQYPGKPPLTIQTDAAKPVDRATVSQPLDELSSNQADNKANESTVESEMTFASPVSPISVARAVSVAGEESVPGTPSASLIFFT